MIKMGLINVDSPQILQIFFYLFESAIPGTATQRVTRFFELKNAFFRGAHGQGKLDPNPGYNLQNPGPNDCEYDDGVFIFELQQFYRTLDWVQALPAGTTICTIMFAIRDAAKDNRARLMAVYLTS